MNKKRGTINKTTKPAKAPLKIPKLPPKPKKKILLKKIKKPTPKIRTVKKPLKKKTIKTQNKKLLTKQPLKIPQKKNITQLVFLSIITLGIYAAIWYIKRTPELNNLKTIKKLNKGTGIFYLILIIALIGLIATILIINPTIYNATSLTLTEMILLSSAGIVLILTAITKIFLAFRTQKIINQAWQNKGTKRKVSSVLTLFLNLCYLQYEINRTINNKELNKRTGPWVWFTILILLIISIIILITLTYLRIITI